MSPPVRVQVRQPSPFPFGTLFDDRSDLQADLERARWLANWLDTKFSVGGFRFGLDGIIGLIPVVGDLLGALAGLYPLMLAQRHRLGKTLQLRMGLNLLIEWAVGSVPLVGDLFDLAYKANLRNVRLLERALEKRGTQR